MKKGTFCTPWLGRNYGDWCHGILPWICEDFLGDIFTVPENTTRVRLHVSTRKPKNMDCVYKATLKGKNFKREGVRGWEYLYSCFRRSLSRRYKLKVTDKFTGYFWLEIE